MVVRPMLRCMILADHHESVDVFAVFFFGVGGAAAVRTCVPAVVRDEIACALAALPCPNAYPS